MNWDEMKEAVRRAAQRELELDIGDKPFDDPQIAGSPYRVRVEGKYLGWTSKKRCEELRKIYAETPSRLRPVGASAPPREGLDGLVAEVGLAAKSCRQIEADILMAQTPFQSGDAANRGVQELRQRLELLHERVLMMQQEHTHE